MWKINCVIVMLFLKHPSCNTIGAVVVEKEESLCHLSAGVVSVLLLERSNTVERVFERGSVIIQT